MTDIDRERGEPAAVDVSTPDSDSGPTGNGRVGPGPDDDATRPKSDIPADENARDWDEEEAVRRGEVATGR